MEFKKIQEDIKNILSDERYIHSKGVSKRAEELAKLYGQDIEKAKIVAIAHDIAKEMSKEETYKYVKENRIQIDEIEQQDYKLLHSKIGAHICVKKYGFTIEMANAIIYHTTGSINMDTFAKIIYIADKTEENRKYVDLNKAIEISNKDLDEGVLYISRIAIAHSIKKKSLIHPDTIYLINKIINKMNNNK